MKRLDFYIQHLLRHEALGVELASGKPVRFRFASGDRASTSVVEHGQVTQMVQEAAPSSALDDLMRQGRASFSYRSKSGEFNVTVETSSPAVWKLEIVPMGRPQEDLAANQKQHPAQSVQTVDKDGENGRPAGGSSPDRA